MGCCVDFEQPLLQRLFGLQAFEGPISEVLLLALHASMSVKFSQNAPGSCVQYVHLGAKVMTYQCIQGPCRHVRLQYMEGRNQHKGSWPTEPTTSQTSQTAPMGHSCRRFVKLRSECIIQETNVYRAQRTCFLVAF